MTTSLDRGSAKIYQFPARTRPAAGERRKDTKPAAEIATLHPTSLQVVNTTFGGGWYHDEAIQAERAGTT
jgi:hypothetical protein